MGQNRHREPDSSHDQLIQDYLENETTPTQEERFRLMLDEASFCHRFALFAIDQGHLHDLARKGLLPPV